MLPNRIEAVPAESKKDGAPSTSTCPRCSGRGAIVCPECRGTGEERNVFWVVVGPCRTCVTSRKGFVTCPKCRGLGVVETDGLPA